MLLVDDVLDHLASAVAAQVVLAALGLEDLTVVAHTDRAVELRMVCPLLFGRNSDRRGHCFSR